MESLENFFLSMRNILRMRFAAGFWPLRFRDLGEILGRILAAEIPEISAGFWPPRFGILGRILAAEMSESRQDFGRRDSYEISPRSKNLKKNPKSMRK